MSPTKSIEGPSGLIRLTAEGTRELARVQRPSPPLMEAMNARADQLDEVADLFDELVAAGSEMLRVERTQGVTEHEFENAAEQLDAALTKVGAA